MLAITPINQDHADVFGSVAGMAGDLEDKLSRIALAHLTHRTRVAWFLELGILFFVHWLAYPFKMVESET
jgi:hypothetical protein